MLTSPRAVRELVEREVIPDPKTATLDACREAYIEHLRLQAAGRRGDGAVIDLATERAKLAQEQSRAQALRNAELEGSLLSRADVVETWTNRLVAIRNRMRSLPKRMTSRVPGFTSAMARTLLKLIDQALNDLAGDASKEPEPGRTRVRPGE